MSRLDLSPRGLGADAHRRIRTMGDPLALSLLALLVFSCSRPILPAGAPLPEVYWRTLQGDRVSSYERRGPLLLLFFRPGCPACAGLADLLRDVPIGDRERILLLLPEGEETTLPVDLALRYPVFLLGDAVWKEAFQIRGTPTLLFYDEERRLERAQWGWRRPEIMKERLAAFFARGDA